MNDLNIHFSRSIKICNHINIALLEDYLDTSKPNNPVESVAFKNFYKYALNRKDYGANQDLIKEVVSIEYEKILFKSDNREICQIASIEKKLNKEREPLMFMKREKIMNTLFILNPYVKTYESFWKIVFESSSDDYLFENIKSPKSDFYFLFQKIGIYDQVSKSNVLEYALNKYGCFVLQLFENGCKTPGKAIEEFASVFEYKTREEYKQIEFHFLQIFYEFLFKKFIIKSHHFT